MIPVSWSVDSEGVEVTYAVLRGLPDAFRFRRFDKIDRAQCWLQAQPEG
jgi:hypothetical protein